MLTQEPNFGRNLNLAAKHFKGCREKLTPDDELLQTLGSTALQPSTF